MSARDAVAVLVLTGACAAVYANALTGEFVYDDTRQIVQNHLIQSNDRLGEAMTRDVWAFKGERDAPWSNYWRPAFVLWLAANHRLFGLENTTGWHAANAALHVAVCAIAYGLLRRLRASRELAFAITLVFAVHPANVESVAWLSGSPSMLSAASFLGALWLALSAVARPRAWKWPAALLVYGVSLLSKEIAIVLPVVLWLALAADAGQSRSRRDPLAPSRDRTRPRRLAAVLPFAAMAAIYLVARIAVLRGFQEPAPWAATPATIASTLPAVLAFYLRQMVVPFWPSPSHPVRPVPTEAIGAMSFFAPLAIVLLAVAVIWRIARRDDAARIGAALCALALLPALNLGVFLPEQIVHDRYLYLPLFGFLIVAFTGLGMILEGRLRWSREKAARACMIASVVAATALAARTTTYNRAWRNELALWTWSARHDPESAFTQSQYAIALRKAGRADEALRAAERSIAIQPNQYAMLERAIIATAQGRLEDAERDLLWIIANTPAELPAYEHLAAVQQKQGRVNDAEATLESARERLPHLRARITTNIAVALYQAGRKEEALAELEGNRALARADASAESKRSLFLLGQLYAEGSRFAESRRALEEYLASTAALRDRDTAALRQTARAALAQLP